MPIIMTTKNGKPWYIGVRNLDECGFDVIRREHCVVEHEERALVESRMRIDFVFRLEEHARDAALLAYLTENPPGIDDSADHLGCVARLGQKVSMDALEFMNYEPFAAMIADVVLTDAGVLEKSKARTPHEIDRDLWHASRAAKEAKAKSAASRKPGRGAA